MSVLVLAHLLFLDSIHLSAFRLHLTGVLDPFHPLPSDVTSSQRWSGIVSDIENGLLSPFPSMDGTSSPFF